MTTSSPIAFTNPDGSIVSMTIDYEYTPAPPVPPVLPDVPTIFGNTSRGASDGAGVANVDGIYGVGRGIRLYCSTTLSAAVVANRYTVGSFKSMTGLTAANLATYDRVFKHHEIDHQIIAGATTLAQWQTDMATALALGTGNLGVCVTADCFVNPSKNPADYLVDGVTHWGVDFDGISGNSTTYHDYGAALDNALDFFEEHDLTWGVPEFGTNKATVDTNDSYRAAWLRKWCGEFKDGGADYVCFWEQSSQSASQFLADATLNTVASIITL